MKQRVYLETTIPSYLTAWPSRDLVIAAHQQVTHQWWLSRGEDFDFFISQLVLDEASSGDPDAAKRRLEILENIPLLDINEETGHFARLLLEFVQLPPKAAADALRISTAVINGMDFLLTWNCSHIANATLRSRVEEACRINGYNPVVICTPEELLEVEQ